MANHFGPPGLLVDQFEVFGAPGRGRADRFWDLYGPAVAATPPRPPPPPPGAEPPFAGSEGVAAAAAATTSRRHGVELHAVVAAIRRGLGVEASLAEAEQLLEVGAVPGRTCGERRRQSQG